MVVQVQTYLGIVVFVRQGEAGQPFTIISVFGIFRFLRMFFKL